MSNNTVTYIYRMVAPTFLGLTSIHSSTQESGMGVKKHRRKSQSEIVSPPGEAREVRTAPAGDPPHFHLCARHPGSSQPPGSSSPGHRPAAPMLLLQSLVVMLPGSTPVPRQQLPDDEEAARSIFGKSSPHPAHQKRFSLQHGSRCNDGPVLFNKLLVLLD